MCLHVCICTYIHIHIYTCTHTEHMNQVISFIHIPPEICAYITSPYFLPYVHVSVFLTERWFQDPRSLYPGQRRSEPVNSLLDGPNGRPGPTVQQHEIDLWTLPGRSHHPSSSSFSGNQSFLPVLPSYVSSVPSAIQGQSVMMQPVKLCRENSLSTVTSGNDVPVPLTMGGDPDTQDPFLSQ